MKKFVILFLALLMLTLYGCGGDCCISPNAEHDCTGIYYPENTTQATTVPETAEANTYHPYNTYAILRAEQNRITEYMQNYMCGDLISSTYVDDSRGVLVVGIKDITDEKVEFFKENISDKDFIVFEEGGNIVFTSEITPTAVG